MSRVRHLFDFAVRRDGSERATREARPILTPFCPDRGSTASKDGCIVQIATRQVADTVIARPAGRIDHLSAKPFEAALMPLVAEAAARRGSLVLDFAEIDYISSVGLRVLMVAAKQMREHQAHLRVASLRGVVAEIFAISRFDRILSVAATVDDALALDAAAPPPTTRSPDSTPAA
jgi:anti-anti-sigma factor